MSIMSLVNSSNINFYYHTHLIQTLNSKFFDKNEDSFQQKPNKQMNTQKNKYHQMHLINQTKKEITTIKKASKGYLLGGGSSLSGCCNKNDYVIQQEEGTTIKEKKNDFKQIKSIPNIDEIQASTQSEFDTQFDYLAKSNQTTEVSDQIRQLIADCFYKHKETLYGYDRGKLFELCHLMIFHVFSEIESINNSTQSQNDDINKLTDQLNEINNQISKYELIEPCLDLKLIIKLLITLNTNRAVDKNVHQQLFKITLDIFRVAANIKHGPDSSKQIKLKQLSSIIEEAKTYFYETGDVFKEAEHMSRKTVKRYHSNNFFIFLNILWITKAERFQGQFLDQKIQIDDELEFYISTLSSIILDSSQEIINYLLLSIRYLLDKGKQRLSTLLQQHGKEKLKKVIIDFLKMISIYKDQNIDLKVYNQIVNLFADPSYRFIVIQILLKSIEIEGLMTNDDKNLILEILIVRCLTEKSDSVSIIFNHNSLIEDSLEKVRVDSQKKQNLLEQQKQIIKQMSKHLDNSQIIQIQDTIETIEDIDNMFGEYQIKTWENDLRKRQYKNHTSSDQQDISVDVTSLYINQSLIFEGGNNIFKEHINQIDQHMNSSNLIVSKDLNNQVSINNALDGILHDFLIANYRYTVKQIKNNNTSLNKQNEGNGCKILSILAEHGIGKSTLLKKLQSQLINKSGLVADERANYIPLMINCIYLDSEAPSVEVCLQSQNLSKQQIEGLKSSERNKLIMLDSYDQHAGDYFNIFERLNLNAWKNTLVIVASALEKTSISDAKVYFNYYNSSGEKGHSQNYTVVKLQQFEEKDIQEYFQAFQNQKIQKKDSNFDKNNYSQLSQMCMKNNKIVELLRCPINLYLLSLLITDINQQEISFQDILESITYSVDIYECFFKVQFNKCTKEFIKNLNQSFDQQQLDQLQNYVQNSYFEYYQNIAFNMFLNKGKVNNFLQIDKEMFSAKQFSLREDKCFQLLSKDKVSQLKQTIQAFNDQSFLINHKQQENIDKKQELSKRNIIEFRHKSIFEYFTARAMKYDFDLHKENIYNLQIEVLEKFNINQRIAINTGINKSEEYILFKLLKLIQTDKNDSGYTQNYSQENIRENNRYIQYIKRSQINKPTDISRIDIGASNLLTTLFISKYPFDKLVLNRCSFSQSYLMKRNNSISFDRCNLSNSIIQNMYKSSIETSNTNETTFDTFQKVFDTKNIYSFHDSVFINENTLISVNNNGYINQFKINDNTMTIVKSQRLTCSTFKTIDIDHNNQIIITTSKSIFVIDPDTFEITFSYKFDEFIQHLSSSFKHSLYFVFLQNSIAYQGNKEDGFQQIKLKGQQSCFSPNQNILVIIDDSQIYIYEYQLSINLINDIKLIKTISQHTSTICKVVFSPSGKYLAISFEDKTCKIWNAFDHFELINTIKGFTSSICSVVFSLDEKYLATGYQDNACQIWNTYSGFELIHTIKGHNSAVSSISFSPDGKYLATISDDTYCKLWNIQKDFEPLNANEGHTSTIHSVAFSPDGNYLATGSADKTCKVWSVHKGYELAHSLENHTQTVCSVSYSPNGIYLATSSKDNTCKIWNTQNRYELIHTIQGQNWIYSVCFSYDSKFLATASEKNACQIWNCERAFELVTAITGHTFIIKSISFSQDGKYLATGSDDKTCRIYNVQKAFELMHTVQGHTYEVQSIAFSPDGKYFSTGSRDNTCKVWNAQKGFTLLHTIKLHSSSICSVVFSPNGKYLVTGSEDKTCKLWNTQKNFEHVHTIQKHTGWVNSIVFSQDGKYLATGSRDNTFKVWDAQKTLEVINFIEGHTGWIHSVAFSTDGKYFVTGSLDSTCKVWNSQKGFEFIKTIKGHFGWIYAVSFSPNGIYLATGSEDKTCKIWNVQKNFELMKTLHEHTSIICSLTFSPNSKYLATGSYDNTCKIWNVQRNFDIICSIDTHTLTIRSVAFSLNGMYLATGSMDYTCKIWNAEKDFAHVRTITGHYYFYSLIFSPNGEYLITASEKNTYQIWSIQRDFELITTIEGHTNSIESFSFSPDGKYLITGSTDQTCKIWNAWSSFELLNTIQRHTGWVYSVSISPNGKYLATGSKDNTSKIWNAEKAFQLIEAIQEQANENCSVSYLSERKVLILYKSEKMIYNLNQDLSQIQFEELYTNNSQSTFDRIQLINKINFFTCEYTL